MSNKPTVPLEEQYVGAMRLWRIWRTDGYSLFPLVFGYEGWLPGKNKCQAPAGEDAIGFYGFSSLREMAVQERMFYESGIYHPSHYVVGSILAHGRIQVHAKGARAEYATPEYLVAEQGYAGHFWAIAKEYNMKIITVEQAKDLKTGLVPYREPDPTFDKIVDGIG